MEAFVAVLVVLLVVMVVAGMFIAKWSKEKTEKIALEESKENDTKQQEKAYQILKHNEEIANLSDDELDARL